MGDKLRSPDFQAIFDASPTPLLVVAPPDWTIVAANEARLKITGTGRDEQIGRLLFDVFPDDPDDPDADGVKNLRASLERVIDTKAPDTMAVQRYAVRGAGGQFVTRWWSPVNTPVLASDGEVALVIHRVEEVTEIVRLRGEAQAHDQLIRDQQAVIDRLRETEAALRRTDQHLRLMVNELNHRVKNTLLMVQSIVAQTLRQSRGPGASDVIAARLTALSLAHDMLTEKHWVGADLHQVIRTAVGHGAQGDDPSLLLEGPDLQMPPTIALSLALTLHELATNAVKYGALSTSAGRVHITWHVETRSDRPVLDLTWRETGGPLVVEPTTRGFGTKLIERRQGLQGLTGSELIFAPDGLRCRLVTEIKEEQPLAL